jgi:hypothetical protein
MVEECMSSKIEIFQPRWHDRKVLIACHKVGVDNEIVFTKAPTLPGVYTIKGSEVEQCPKESNGVINCYAVPLDKLRRKDGEETGDVVSERTDNSRGNGQDLQPKLF